MPMRNALPTPTNLRSFLRDRGWKQSELLSSEDFYTLSCDEFDGRQIRIPANVEFQDYSDSMNRVLEKIGDIYNLSIDSLVLAVENRDSDSGTFRIKSSKNDSDSLPFEYFSRAIEAVRQMVLSSACLAVDPRTHYKRLRRAEAGQVVENTRFNHTERGSFILRLSCDVSAVEVPSLFDDDGTGGSVVRATFQNIYRSASGLSNAIVRDEVEEFIGAQKETKKPIISANFCDALAALLAEPSDLMVDIGCEFSQRIPSTMIGLKPVRIKQEFSSIISDVSRELRDEEEPETDTFVGTVEELQGELGSNGKRSGSVIFALLLSDTETVRVRADLNADQYAIADLAHMDRLGYVQVKGTLLPGRQPRLLREIGHFSQIHAPHGS